MPTVFYLGATGYVGGAVIADLVGAYPDLEVTALVRNPAHIDAFKAIGVKVLQGSFKDLDLITSHARAADITINLGDSDDVGLTTAILAGQTARVAEDHKPRAALLHTSGVAVFGDHTTEGKHDPKAKVWNDGNEDDIRSINAKMLHGAIDAQILRASEEGHTVSYIAAPGGVVGPSTGPVPTSSLFFRFISEVFLAYKKAVHVGEGSNVFYAVRLDDLVIFYRLLFAHILSGKDANASPYSRYYLAVNNPIPWTHISTVVGAELKRAGKLQDDKPQSISASVLQSPALEFMAPSQHVRAERAKALGWVPRHVVLEEWAEEGVKSTLARMQN